MGRPKSLFPAAASQYVGTKDAAAILGVSVSTVHKMLTEGRLQAWKTNGGHRRIKLDELRALASQQDLPPTASNQPASFVATHRQGPLRVLVVEDNPVVAKRLAHVFERFGDRVDVTVTGDAAEALIKIAEGHGQLVVTDLVMAPFDGFHLLKVLKSSRKYPEIAVVVVTGLSESQIAAKGGIDPAIPVYHKPVNPERLAGFVDALLHLRRIERSS